MPLEESGEDDDSTSVEQPPDNGIPRKREPGATRLALVNNQTNNQQTKKLD